MDKSSTLQAAGIYSQPENIEQALAVNFIIDRLLFNNFSVFVCSKTFNKLEYLGIKLNLPVIDEDLNRIDFVVSIGGDGTVLKAAHFTNQSGKPILAINNGRLGFLADINKQEIDSILLDLKGGEYSIESRTNLLCSIDTYSNDHEKFALNEVAIFKQGKASLLTIQTYINNEYLSSFWADGIIIATPTGSTAYSLSVGGPILTPNSGSLIINPIAPHTLTVRPIVISDTSILTVKVSGRNIDYVLSHDSNQISLKEELQISIKKSVQPTNFIKFSKITYYSTLREKLMWGADIRN